MTSYVVGQRYLSEAEPDLGLGLVERIEARRVLMRFPASETVRQYAVQSAPIKRVLFRVGDEIESEDGLKFRVETTEEREGLVTYRSGRHRLLETELAGTLRFSKPEERLLGGYWDPSPAFDLRLRTWKWGHKIRKSPARGFLGARIELIPHQLFISAEIAGRPLPRALLADEVGLGKTIEAGLIIHRLLKSARIGRVLVLVPESLVHQWWVEMFRRFHLSFTIAGASYCEAVTESEPSTNPFASAECMIVSLDWIATEPSRATEMAEAGWDLVVVDEAHHLETDGASYRIVETLSRAADGLLLLTATPEQLGEENHFARLRLLDPDRYRSFESYQAEAARYREVAALAAEILDGPARSEAEATELATKLPKAYDSLRQRVREVLASDVSGRPAVVRELLDRHGPGRVVFRNQRSVLDRVPERKVHPVELEWPEDAGPQFDVLRREFAVDTGASDESLSFDYSDDVRARWLAGFVESVRPHKVLVLCRFKEKAMALKEMLREQTRVTAGVFHEELSLLERDRNAAWFAEEEDGAQVLLCSEIGSEGRNFQFAHHLVLFDLPLSPELLEQRIGRLYRIGQEHTVEIHVAVLRGSAQQLLFRWYHDGLDAFENSLPSGAHYEELSELVRELGLKHLSSAKIGEVPRDLDLLIERTRELRTEVAARLEQGRDRLLELGSYQPEASRVLVDEIRKWDQSTKLDRYVLDVLEHLGVELDEIAPRTFVFKKGNQLVVDDLPGLRGGEVAMTASRERATRQGELDFLTWDHPMVMGAMELLTSSENGNSAVAFLRLVGSESLLLEALFVLDVVAPASLFVDRFLPPTPIRVVVDQRLVDVTDAYPQRALAKRVTDAKKSLRYAERGWQEELVPGMIARVRALAEDRCPAVIETSRNRMRELMDGEHRRLRALALVNDHIRPVEIERVAREIDLLDQAIASASLRLDALRLIWRSPDPPEV